MAPQNVTQPNPLPRRLNREESAEAILLLNVAQGFLEQERDRRISIDAEQFRRCIAENIRLFIEGLQR